tara:strand:- start:1640 stop:3109 length:1470 start_codon:yes stop_codon:yes gene_type:complete
MKNRRFADFKVGDFLNFEEVYTNKEFEKFSTISGDKNALHYDQKYSQETEFKEPIVPLHLSIAPFSRIAGMYMPGLPSLYLGHKISALKPVFYNQKTNYSAKIVSINSEYRILTIRVLISQANIIKVIGNLTVQSTKSEWFEKDNIIEIKNDKDISYALITGSTGEIGKSIAIRLASMGYNLILHSRGNKTKVKELSSILSKYKSNFKFIISDLEKDEGIERVSNEISELGLNISTIVHSASSPYNSSLNKLINTNYKALKIFVNASLNSFISKQKGRIIFISTIYLFHPIQGFEDYIASKSMTTNFLSNLNKFYSNFNIVSKSILPTVTDTPFSSESKEINKLIPEEVADKVIDLIKTDDKESLVLDIGKVIHGNYGFSPVLNSDKKFKQNELKNTFNNKKITSEIMDDEKQVAKKKLDDLIRSVLNLQKDHDLNNVEYGNTPGWDSMAQFQLVAEIEDVFKVSFTSYQLEHATSYKSLNKIVLDTFS